MVVALIALLVALTTGAYAASKIGTSDLENGAVTAKKLHKKAVKTKKISQHAVGVTKVKDAIATNSEISDVLAQQRFVETANGVGNNAGCAGGELGVVVSDGNGEPVDDRFTFQVPGAPEAFGQIRSDGSIRNSSANVSGVTHTTDTGVYCVQFTSVGDLEAAVVSIHVN
jgi:hypothetical protein